VSDWARGEARTCTVAVDCAGTLHPGTVTFLAGRFGHVVVAGCSPSSCVHRHGAALADARILDAQRPAVAGRSPHPRVRVVHHSAAEWGRVASGIRAWRDGGSAPPGRAGGHVALRVLLALGVSVLLLAGLALGSRAPQGAVPRDAVLRLGWRVTGQTRDVCRDLTSEELAARPAHMRTARECRSTALRYVLEAAVDGEVVARKTVRAPGLRADRPLAVEEDLAMAPGDHDLAIAFRPEDPGSGGTVLRFVGRVRFERGRVVLITAAGGELVRR
jgi:coenzyme F420-reducing hydrogenase delta subunit